MVSLVLEKRSRSANNDFFMVSWTYLMVSIDPLQSPFLYVKIIINYRGVV